MFTSLFTRRLYIALPSFAYRHASRFSKPVNPGFHNKELNKFDKKYFDEAEEEYDGEEVNAAMTPGVLSAEHKKQRMLLKRATIRNKYFRAEKLPTLLSFGEKEQIRELHTNDPNEWCAERLAESFPATPDIVRKVLAKRSQPRSQSYIERHDRRVLENWKQLRSGELDDQLSQELRDHLAKFTHRTKANLFKKTSHQFTRVALPQPATNEFESIITSCPQYAAQAAQDVIDNSSSSSKSLTVTTTAGQLSDETAIASCADDSESGRLEDDDSSLKKYVFKSLTGEKKAGSSVLPPPSSSDPEHDSVVLKAAPKYGSKLVRLQDLKKAMANSEDNPFANDPVEENEDEFEKKLTDTDTGKDKGDFVQKYASSEIMLSFTDQTRFPSLHIKSMIKIPRKLRRKDCIYRVADCYYAGDGEFLYRVPGMTGGHGADSQN